MFNLFSRKSALNQVSKSLGAQGYVIKSIFDEPFGIAELHGVLTSKRGDYFRKKLLSKLKIEISAEEILEMKRELDMEEYGRHIHKLIDSGLVERTTIGVKKEKAYVRTELGEKAVNALREFERSTGSESSKRVYDANFGYNSIRLFLKVYSMNVDPVLIKKKGNGAALKVRFSPSEIGKISRFLYRSVDGLTAIDKLNESGILSYHSDGYVYLNARIARAYYKYLKRLFFLLQERGMTDLEKAAQKDTAAK